MLSFDLIIFIALFFFFVLGLVRGFILQSGAFVGFFVSLWVAKHYYIAGATLIKPSLEQWPLIQNQLALALAYIALFIIAQMVVGLLVRLLDMLVKRTIALPVVSMVNRFGGAAIGVAEGILLLGAGLFLLSNVPLSAEWTKSLNASRLVPLVRTVSALIYPFLPDMRQFVPSTFDEPAPPKGVDTKALIEQYQKK